MNNRYTLVTGANRGIGLEIAQVLAHRSTPLILACRTISSAESTRQLLQNQGVTSPIEAMELDLSSFRSVVRLTDTLKENRMPVGQLINNAGILCKGFRTTEDGFEMNLQVNYLSVYLLSRLMVDIIQKDGLILNTTSLTRKWGRVNKDLFHPRPASYIRLLNYGKSKAALTLFTLSLSQRLKEKNIKVNAADPWIVATDMIQMGRWFDPLAKKLLSPLVYTPLQGAQSAIKGVTDPRFLSQNGQLFFRGKIRSFSPRFHQKSTQDRLWQETEKIIASVCPEISDRW